MSAIAGIVYWDRAPVVPGQIESMTRAMLHRGQDGICHWTRANVALGHCMLRTTPEALQETQPLVSADGNVVLVMDGRVDNYVELRGQLLAAGAVLRTKTDAEMVLAAYLVWGEACPDRIIGEFVFVLWDARAQLVFAARDAIGTHVFNYYSTIDCFAFASEISGLLALAFVERKLCEEKILDYIVPDFARDDQESTVFENIKRLPAGHAMKVSRDKGVRAWRYWDPASLTLRPFRTEGECVEAFLEQFRIAVSCRLRTIGPVGAMLSGGMDSSSIVGLIGKEFSGQLSAPLQTYTLVGSDLEMCHDGHAAREVLNSGNFDATVISPSALREAGTVEAFLADMGKFADPFFLERGPLEWLICRAAQAKGCRVMLEGIAGDLLFWSPMRSMAFAVKTKQWSLLPRLLRAYHQHGLSHGMQDIARYVIGARAPTWMRNIHRQQADRRQLQRDGFEAIREDVAASYLALRQTVRRSAPDWTQLGNDQRAHAQWFTSGLVSFAHEYITPIAMAKNIEMRSPFSDRRLVEFAIRMPVAMKLCVPSYKATLRAAMASTLPKRVLQRSTIGYHPGHQFVPQFAAGVHRCCGDLDLAGLDTMIWSASRHVPVKQETQGSELRLLRTNGVSSETTLRLRLLSRWLAALSDGCVAAHSPLI